MSELKADLKLVSPDPFDPAALRLDQSFSEGPAVKKLLTTIPVRKPAHRTLCAYTRARSIASTLR